jgi:copper transport protein
MLATVSMAGHASTGPMRQWSVPTDVAHLAGVAVWLGGLVVLAACVLPGPDPGAARDVAARFSGVAFGAVIGIVATGMFQSWRQVRSIGGFTSTTFGRILLVKVLAVGLLVGFAALSRQAIRARQRAATTVPALAVPGGPGAMPAGALVDTRRLRRSVLAEVAVAPLVLALTASLVNAVPSREVQARAREGSSGPFTATPDAPEMQIELTVDPARAGANKIHVYLYPPGGGGEVLPVPEFEGSLSLPTGGVGPLPVEFQPVFPGHFTAEGVEIPVAGTWRLDVIARPSDFEQIRAMTTFTVR